MAPNDILPSPQDIARLLGRLDPAYAPTPLHSLPALARKLGIAALWVKDEGARSLGSFKSLGGTYAGLRALARHAGVTPEALLEAATRPQVLPALLCASDGNHGLAVAAAARAAGAPCTVFLHSSVPQARAARITAMGAAITWVQGTYDDAVDAAVLAAEKGDGLLVADTALGAQDPVVGDVMAGYGVIAAEIRAQATAPLPTHLYVQAGVGGLAAAMIAGLDGFLAAPAAMAVVEPAEAASVGAALAAGRVLRLPGALHSVAEMLSCGEASGPALALLQPRAPRAIAVPEDRLVEAPRLLGESGGPASTPSGATGFSGLLQDIADGRHPGPDARVLLVISERALS
ncbi:PLP-dependent lyase/thiolase [Pseudoroseomonas deserti]|uniref:PLP-dependent lyase/thiolase n=1 Tax=Teichococcus deserti TaxID=1817963 RepID=A0A1V2H0C2_9PROT|nr:pyridoxal-phosphate dependent enzyme [Pseudoroseomonas deserti]ONG51776.1 PLP-dependent lyase/thiolase [Pseudoroseomonas deserti]